MKASWVNDAQVALRTLKLRAHVSLTTLQGHSHREFKKPATPLLSVGREVKCLQETKTSPVPYDTALKKLALIFQYHLMGIVIVCCTKILCYMFALC